MLTQSRFAFLIPQSLAMRLWWRLSEVPNGRQDLEGLRLDTSLVRPLQAPSQSQFDAPPSYIDSVQSANYQDEDWGLRYTDGTVEESMVTTSSSFVSAEERIDQGDGIPSVHRILPPQWAVS